MDSTELTHLLISWVTLSFAFSVNAAFVGLPLFLTYFPIVLIGLGTGFVFHELAHRYIARRMGCWAVYRAWMPGLGLALGLAIFTGGRFIFAAPGAVYIGGRYLSREENGKISLAGPLTNMLVGLGFLALAFTQPEGTLLALLGTLGAFVNFFLAFFNLIPFPPLDGSKVFSWNPLIWALAMAVPAVFLFVV